MWPTTTLGRIGWWATATLDSSAGPSACGARRALDARYVATVVTLCQDHGGAGLRPGGARRWTLAWRRSSTMDRAQGTSVVSSPTTCRRQTVVDGVASAQPDIAAHSSSATGERGKVAQHRCSACSDSTVT
jgi:hypothetical protein